MDGVQVAFVDRRVWSTSYIPNNTFFGPFRGDIIKLTRRVLELQEPARSLKEDKSYNISTDEQEWLPIIPGARTKADQTLEMIRGPDGEMYFRTTCDVIPRDELRAWFCSSLSRELGIMNENNIEIEGEEHQCPRCHQSFDQLNLLSAHTLLHCTAESENVSEETCMDDNEKRSAFTSQYEKELNDEELGEEDGSRSDYIRLEGQYSLLSKPRLASLISSFAASSASRKARAESLADYHKKEFRKKFQGNEHYLRKHLYRGGPGARRIAKSVELFGSNFSSRLSFAERMVKSERIESYLEEEEENAEENTACETSSAIKRSENGDSTSGNWSVWEEEENRRVENRKEAFYRQREKGFRLWRPFRATSEDEEQQDAHQHPGIRNCVPTLEQGVRNGIISRAQPHRNAESREAEIELELENRERGRNLNEEEHSEESEHRESAVVSSNNCIEEEKTDETDSEIPKLSTSDMKPANLWVKQPLIAPSGPRLHQGAGQKTWFVPESGLVSNIQSATEVAQFYSRTLPYSISSFAPRYPAFHPFSHPYMVTSSFQAPTRTPQGFTCDYCGKVYCRKYVLKIHMRTHTGFKPLRCKFCDKSFSDPSNMKKHVKLHETENTVHKCKHCGRNFVRYRGLLNHIKSKHMKPMALGYIY